MPPAPIQIASHWHQSMENLSISSLEFYRSIETALAAKQVPEIKVSRVWWNEGGLLSGKREYLRIEYGRLVFDICAAPFGHDYFFSWWMGERLPRHGVLYLLLFAVALPMTFGVAASGFGFFGGFLFTVVATVLAASWITTSAEPAIVAVREALLSVPVFGALYKRFARPLVYYAEDTKKTFQETIARVMMDVLSGVLTINQMSPIKAPEVTNKIDRRGSVVGQDYSPLAVPHPPT